MPQSLLMHPVNFAVVFDKVNDDPVPANVEVTADETAVKAVSDDLIAYNPVAIEMSLTKNQLAITTLRSRTASTFGSYSNSNNINLHQQDQSNIGDCDLPTFDDVQAVYNPTLGKLRVMSQMNADKGVKMCGKCAVKALVI